MQTAKTMVVQKSLQLGLLPPATTLLPQDEKRRKAVVEALARVLVQAATDERERVDDAP